MLLNLIFLIFLPNYVSCKNSTLRARVTTSGLHFFSDIGHHIVDYEVKEVTFPDITLPIDGGIGSGIVKIKNLKLDHLVSPIFYLKLVPPDGIAWKSRSGTIKVVGPWYAVYRILFPIYMSGTVQAVANDIRLLLQAKVFVQDNHPQIAIDTCEVTVMNLDVIIGGGIIPWIVNLFRPEVSRIIKSAIDEQLCISAQTVLLDEANDALMSLPMHIKAVQQIYVNYLFFKNPIATTSYIEAEVYSDVVYGDTYCPLEAKPMDRTISAEDRMIHFWVSEHIPNCLLYSAHQNGLLSFAITKDSDQGKLKHFLSTSCSLIPFCIGRFLPQLRQKYPNQYVDFYFGTSTAPVLQITLGGIAAKASLNLDLFLSPWKQQTSSLAKLEVNITTAIEPCLIDAKLSGILKNVSVVISEKNSRIGHFNERLIDVVGRIISQAITAVVKSLLEIGIHLPLIDNITLSNNTLIITESGYARIGADFVYIQ